MELNPNFIDELRAERNAQLLREFFNQTYKYDATMEDFEYWLKWRNQPSTISFVAGPGEEIEMVNGWNGTTASITMQPDGTIKRSVGEQLI